MSAERFKRVESVFEAVVDLPAAERARLLDERCAGDAELRAQVEELLSHDVPTSDQFLSGTLPGGGHRHGSLPHPPLLEQFGRYRIVRIIGEGGMGSVYEAEQDSPRRAVALKVIRTGLASRQVLSRFEHEAQVLGQLRHPGIAQIYEAGVFTPPEREKAGLPGTPYFAMELIEGLPVDVFARNRGLGVREKLALMALLCDAVHHAHVKGIVHRDLKPGNVLVDEAGHPKILDFGVARITGSDVRTATIQTSPGQLLGTLPYMSPEQVAGDPAAIDARSDVYSLGVMLYELLADRLPLDIRDRAIPEAARIIREEDPSRLSSINAAFRGDIETIVSKALSKERERRYSSAAELASDIRRHLNDEPITARPASTLYQLRKFARRNRGLVSGVATALVMLAGASVVSTYWAIAADRSRVQAQNLAEQSKRNEKAARQLARRASLSAAAGHIQAGAVGDAILRLQDVPEEFRGWEWKFLRHSADQSGFAIETPRDPLFFTQTTGSSQAGVIGSEGEFWMVDLATGRKVGEMRHEANMRAFLSPDGKTVLFRPVLVESRDDPVKAYDVATGDYLWTLSPYAPRGSYLAWSPDSRSLLSLHRPAMAIHVHDARTGVITRTIDLGDPSLFVALPMSDGKSIALHGDDDRVLIRNIETGAQKQLQMPAAGAFSTDGRLYIAVSHSITWIYDGRTGTILFKKPCISGAEVGAVAGDGSLVAIPDASGGIGLHEPFTGSLLSVVRGNVGNVRQMQFTSDSRTLLALCADGRLRGWNADESSTPFAVPAPPEYTGGGGVSPDGTLVAAMGWGAVRMWNAVTGKEMWLRVLARETNDGVVAFSSDSTRAAVSGFNTTVFELDAKSGRVIESSRVAPERPTSIAWVGGRIAVGAASGSAWVLPAGGGGGVPPVPIEAQGTGPVRSLTSNGTVLGVARDGAVSLFSTRGAGDDTWRLANVGTVAVDGPTSISIGHDSGVIAIGDRDGGVTLATMSGADDANSVRVLRRVPGAGVAVTSLALSPDGTRVMVSRRAGAIRVYECETGDELCSVPGPEQVLHSLVFTPDGKTVVGECVNYPLIRYETEASAEVLRERRLVQRGRIILDRVWTRDALIEDLDKICDEAVNAAPEVREVAKEIARGRGEQVNHFNSVAWGNIRFSSTSRETALLAVRQLRRVNEIWPDNHSFLNTLGVALYRAGEYEEAIAVLRRGMELSKDRYPQGHPSDVAFVAMSLAKLNRSVEGRIEAERVRQLMQDPGFANDAENQVFLREVEDAFRP